MEWIDAADPGRVHTEGRMARVALEEARDRVAALVGTRSRQVIFTSGATESINAAAYGALHAGRGERVVMADVEHSAVREASERYASSIVTIGVDRTASSTSTVSAKACPIRVWDWSSASGPTTKSEPCSR